MKHKALIIILILLLSLAAIIYYASSHINVFLENKVRSTLQSYIDTTSNRIYDYEYRNLKLDVFAGNTYLTGVKVTPRQGAMDSLQSAYIGFLVTATMDSLAIEGLSLVGLLRNGSVSLDNIHIDNLSIRYLFNDDYVNPDTTGEKSSPFKDIFSKNLKRTKIDRIEFINISAFANDINTVDTVFVSFDSANMTVLDVYTDIDLVDELQPLQYKSLEMSAKNFIGNFVKDHTFLAGAFSMNTTNKELILSDFHFGPTSFDFKDTTKQFIRSVNDIDLKELVISGINFDTWYKKSRLEISKIYAENPTIQVSLDLRWPKPMFERPYLSTRIRNVSIPIKIDTVQAKGGYIYYREIFADEKPPLEIHFTHASASYLNVSNDPSVLAENPHLTFKADAKFLDAGWLHSTTVFTIADTMNSFDMKVRLDTMSLVALNPILEGQAHTKLNGTLNTLAMNFHGDKFGSKGDFVFDYSHLQIEIFKEVESKDGKKLKKNWLLNTVVNPLVKSNNNLGNKDFKPGTIEYQRPLDVSFYGLVWQSLKSGMVSTMVPDKMAEKMKEKKQEGKK